MTPLSKVEPAPLRPEGLEAARSREKGVQGALGKEFSSYGLRGPTASQPQSTMVFLGPGTRTPASALRGLKKKCTSGTPPLSLFLLYTPSVSLSRPFPLTNLSAESEPFFRFPQTPGYIRVEMTPGKYRDLGEPSQFGSTQGGWPLVFGRSDGVGVPIFVGAFAPPPPTATQGQREGGGTAKNEVPFPGPPPSFPRVLFGSTSRSGALEAYGKQIVFGASRIALAMAGEGGATRVGSLSGTYPPPSGVPHRESESQRACNGPSSPCWAPLFPGIDPVPLRPRGLGATRGKEKKKIQGTMGGGFPIFKVRGPANSLPQSCLYGPDQDTRNPAGALKRLKKSVSAKPPLHSSSYPALFSSSLHFHFPSFTDTTQHFPPPFPGHSLLHKTRPTPFPTHPSPTPLPFPIFVPISQPIPRPPSFPLPYPHPYSYPLPHPYPYS